MNDKYPYFLKFTKTFKDGALKGKSVTEYIGANSPQSAWKIYKDISLNQHKLIYSASDPVVVKGG